MSKAKEYYEEVSVFAPKIYKNEIKTMNHKTLEDVEELIEKITIKPMTVSDIPVIDKQELLEQLKTLKL